MDSERAAQLTLALYAITAAGVVVWQAVRCPVGWQPWLLYVIERVYVPFLFHWRANRRCPFPQTGPGLIIANHRSPADPLMIWMNHHLGETRGPLRVISFMMAKEYYEVPGVHWICRHTRVIPVERHGRDMKPAREALQRLRDGGLVGIFPEGRINLDHGLLEGDSGVAWLALRANVPVFPVFIHGTPQGQTMVEPFRRPSRVRVTYGEPVDLSSFGRRRVSRELLREVTDMLMERLAELGGVPYQRSDSHTPPETLPLDRASP